MNLRTMRFTHILIENHFSRSRRLGGWSACDVAQVEFWSIHNVDWFL